MHNKRETGNLRALVALVLLVLILPLAVVYVQKKTVNSSKAAENPAWVKGTAPVDLPKPVSVILDTDMASDVDDAMAVAQINQLMKLGEVNILAVVTNVANDYSAPAVRAINAWYGHQAVPVGAYKGNALGNQRGSDFTYTITNQFGTPGDTRASYPDAVSVYRKTLAAAANNSVVIESIGFMTNLRDLLVSPPDKFSTLTGRDLVISKVRRLTYMGGDYPYSLTPEWNFKRDATASSYVMANWPTEMVAVGYTLGSKVSTGPSPARDPNTDPLAKIWSLTQDQQTNGKRMAWDSLTTLYTGRGLSAYFSVPGIGGTNTVNAVTGSNTWSRTPMGNVSYLGNVKSYADLAKTIESLVNMTNASCKFNTRVIYTDPVSGKQIDKVSVRDAEFTRQDVPGWKKDVLETENNSFYSSGLNSPCYGKAVGTCIFDTRTDYIDTNNNLNISITIGPNYYNWTTGIGWWAVDHDIASVPRWKQNSDAPCYGMTRGACNFSSRTVLYRKGSSFYDETITTGNKIFMYAKDTGWKAMANHDLTANSHYGENINSPCYGKSAGQCSFNNNVQYFDKVGVRSEFLTIGNTYYSWSETAGWWTISDNRQIGYAERFLEANGPCWIYP